jgi:ABC-type glycerol-3-phosphate transport system permease component
MSTIDASNAPAAPTPQRPRGRKQRSVRTDVHKLIGGVALHAILAGLGFLFFLPFLWMILTSLKHLEEVGLQSWIPEQRGWHFANYLEVFRQIPFARFYWNSLLIACWVTFLQVFTSSLAAFSFARLQWKGRDQVFLLYLCTMMLPGLVLMIPNYQIMISLGLVDTMVGLILPGAFSAFGTFLLRQFMLSIPSSLDEAAQIDGASKWRLYWDVILPLARPGMVTLAIFTFMGSYNSFFWPLVMLKSEHKYTLPIGLLSFSSSAGEQTNLLMAAVTMSVLPMILVFIILQKQLVKGIQLGAVKG